MSDIAFGEWLNTGHVARLLKISPSSLEKARSLGRGPYAALPYHKIGRLVRYRRTDIESFLSTQRIVGVTRR
ncbi:DNA-binding protein [Phaeobacter sp. LSS9]|nr:DNA-binding protein [Phaeobacter sp. LSS9]